MPEIKLITPPDSIHDSNKSVLLINFDDSLKQDFNEAMKDIKQDLNIYMYDFEKMLNEKWLVETVSIVDHIFINLNGLDSHWLTGYILSKSKTYYLVSDSNKPYNSLNNNRIYKFEQATKVFVPTEEKQ